MAAAPVVEIPGDHQRTAIFMISTAKPRQPGTSSQRCTLDGHPEKSTTTSKTMLIYNSGVQRR
jgi:hypothetical protein